MAYTRIDQLELMLGERQSYIAYSGDIEMLREWAILKGHNRYDIERMGMLELTNLYHAPDPTPSQQSVDIHDIIVKVLEAVNAPGFEVSLTRRVARAEMQQEILSGEATKKLIQETLENLAPRQLIVTSDNGVMRLDGVHHYMTDKIIRIAALGHPIMMVGPAGCGKTTIAANAAYALNLPFYITSTINDTHELMGFTDGYGKYHSTPFRQAFEFGGLWVADEIDAWDASALLTANSALANGYASFPDNDRPTLRNPAFRMVATANTFGNGADRVYVGRNELDAASIDRFATVNIGYDLNLERIFANGNTNWLEHVWQVRKKINEKNIRHVASSRAIAMGSQALAVGLEWSDVEEMYLLKGMSKADREKLK